MLHDIPLWIGAISLAVIAAGVVRFVYCATRG